MANIYDKASLVMIPSGTKASKIFSQKPVNGDGDFTFSRSTAATRVNADGNIEKETQNLLLQSNSFTTGWSLSNVTMTSGQAGYDGTNDAWLMTDTNSGGYGIVDRLVTTGGITTFSCYAKSGTTDIFGLRPIGGSSPYVFFDLSNGTFEGAGDTANLIDWDIQDAGNGWYRCSVTTSATATQVLIYIATTGGGLAPSGSTIYIQDAQVEQGLVARDYIETTTAAVEGGITDNVPRLDYTDSSCPALLLEPQRTNNVVNSEYLVGISAVNASTSANETTSPEGVNNATKLSALIAAPSSQWVRYYNIVQPNQKQALSIYAKAGNIDDFTITYYDMSTGDLFFNYDLGAGSVSAPTGSAYYVDADIQDMGNGWYRCIAVVNAQASGTNAQFQVSAGVQRVVSNIGDYVYIYGYQWEQDATYATSYIPTYGTSVTRNIEDLGNILLPNFDDENNYSVMFDLTRKGVDNSVTGDFFEFRKTNYARVVRFWVDAPSAQVRFRDDVQGSATMSTIPFAASDTKKICVVCNGTTFKTFVDGALDETYNIVTPLSLSRFYMTSKSFDLNQLLVFKSALSNEEAIALTTI